MLAVDSSSGEGQGAAVRARARALTMADDTKFKRGQSGNPNGRPKGSRNKLTCAIEALIDDEGEEIARKAIELAKAGDMAAIRLCLDRIAPPRKDRCVRFELLKMETAKDATIAGASIVNAVATGDLTPSEAGDLIRMVESYIRTLQVCDFESRFERMFSEPTVRQSPVSHAVKRMRFYPTAVLSSDHYLPRMQTAARGNRLAEDNSAAA
jgi:Family of unknown function (DUF5681)